MTFGEIVGKMGGSLENKPNFSCCGNAGFQLQ